MKYRIPINGVKLIIIFALTSFFSTANSQSKSEDEITVEGSAKTKVRPDIATFTLTIEKTDTLENKAIRSLNIGIDNLVRILTKIGFANKSIKISDYKISTSSDEDKIKKYTASNILKLEFGINNQLIDAFYNELQKNDIKDLDVSFETMLSDNLEKATRLKLVQRAIDDAKANANNIIKALGLNISKIKQVYKNNGGTLASGNEINTIQFTPPKVVKDTDLRFKTSFDKFEVDDIELEEKITIVFEVSK